MRKINFRYLNTLHQQSQHTVRYSTKSSTIYTKVTYFIVALFAFKMDKVLTNQTLDTTKMNRTEFLFLKTITISFTVKIVELFMLHLLVYFILFFWWSVYVIKRWKNRRDLLCLKQSFFFSWLTFDRRSFVHSKNKKCSLSSLMQIVELFTLHCIVYSAF